MFVRLFISGFLSLALCFVPYLSKPAASPRYSFTTTSLNTGGAVDTESPRVFYSFTPRPGLSYEVRVPSTRASEIATIMNRLMATHLEVEKLLGTTGLSVNVTLLPVGQFYQLTGAPNWVNAMYYKNTILIPVSDQTVIDDESFVRTIKHEYLHAVMDKLADGRCPGWVEEGLAQLVEGAASEELNGYFYHWVRQNGLISFKKLQHGFTDLNEELAPVAYAQSAIAVRMLIEKYGYGSMRNYFDSLGEGVNAELAFSRAFGVDEFYFQEYLLESL